MNISRICGSVLVLLFAMSAISTSQTHHTAPSDEIGRVHFPISCENPSTQQDFDHAMSLLHSFWYYRALKEFTEISIREPQCAMAYWGIAMSHFHLLWEPPTAQQIDYARAALKKAKHAGAKTKREQMYIDAVEAFFQDAETKSHRDRLLAYEKAMEQITVAYPDDQEAAILYALALNATALKSDKTFANNKKAGEILLKVFERQPDHPGVAHYIIHSYDSPQLASNALNAAHKYAKIAPAAPHALHMPSHIFIRLGLWEDNIETNLASAKAGQEYAQANDPDATSFDALHAWDYIVYGYLQMSQDKKAKAIIERAASAKKVDRPNLAAAYALAAIPARYALERKQWSEAVALTLRPEVLTWDKYPWVEGLTDFAAALGAARSGNAQLARTKVAELRTQHEASLAKKDAYWAGQVDILRQAAEAWANRAEGKNDEALRMMRTAAEMEDATDKHPVTPGSVIPMRELLGELLLELGQPKEALVEFEKSLESAVNRFNGIFGAAKAAEQAGETQKAESYYRKLITLCEDADTNRAELEYAKRYLAVK